MRAALVDAGTGATASGFGFDTSVPMVEDALNGELRWKTNSSWPAGASQVQVKLEMQGCSLYSLTVSSD